MIRSTRIAPVLLLAALALTLGPGRAAPESEAQKEREEKEREERARQTTVVQVRVDGCEVLKICDGRNLCDTRVDWSSKTAIKGWEKAYLFAESADGDSSPPRSGVMFRAKMPIRWPLRLDVRRADWGRSHAVSVSVLRWSAPLAAWDTTLATVPGGAVTRLRFDLEKDRGGEPKRVVARPY